MAKRYLIMCMKQDGESGHYVDKFCQYRWRTGRNLLTLQAVHVVKRKLGGVDRGQGTTPATLAELFLHLGSVQKSEPVLREDIEPPEDFDGLDEEAQANLAEKWEQVIADTEGTALAKFETEPVPAVQGSAVLPPEHAVGAASHTKQQLDEAKKAALAAEKKLKAAIDATERLEAREQSDKVFDEENERLAKIKAAEEKAAKEKAAEKKAAKAEKAKAKKAKAEKAKAKKAKAKKAEKGGQ